MAKSSLRGSQVLIMNATVVDYPGRDTQQLLLFNNTLIEVRLHEPYRDSQLNELLYVIIVIVFYATALMTLIITQIKRQRREGTEVDYYDEYLQRNSEVKQTCQTATNIVTRQSQPPPPALATAAFAAAAAGTLLGRVPLSPDEVTDSLLGENGDTQGAGESGGGGGGGGGGGEGFKGGMGAGSSGTYGSRILHPREKSPMLESIPDEEAEA